MRNTTKVFSGTRDELRAFRAKDRLEFLRGLIESESISQGELLELQSLKDYIEPSDVLLLEWAGVPENNQS